MQLRAKEKTMFDTHCHFPTFLKQNRIQKVKPIRNIRVFIKSMMRNPYICIRQMTRRFHSFRYLVIQLSAERSLISIVQIGANDGVNGDPLGDLILNQTEKIKAVLIEPQSGAHGRLLQRYARSAHVVCLNTAIDKKLGNRTHVFHRSADRSPKNRTNFGR